MRNGNSKVIVGKIHRVHIMLKVGHKIYYLNVYRKYVGLKVIKKTAFYIQTEI